MLITYNLRSVNSILFVFDLRLFWFVFSFTFGEYDESWSRWRQRFIDQFLWKMMLETIYMGSMNRSINLCIQCFSFLICLISSILIYFNLTIWTWDKDTLNLKKILSWYLNFLKLSQKYFLLVDLSFWERQGKLNQANFFF